MHNSKVQTNENLGTSAWTFCANELPPQNSEPFIVTDGEGFFSIGYSNWLYRTPEGQLRMPERYGEGMDINYWMPLPEESLWILANVKRHADRRERFTRSTKTDERKGGAGIAAAFCSDGSPPSAVTVRVGHTL